MRYIAWIVVGLMLHGCVPVTPPSSPSVSYAYVKLDDGTPCVVAYSHDTPQPVAFGFSCDSQKIESAAHEQPPQPAWQAVTGDVTGAGVYSLPSNPTDSAITIMGNSGTEIARIQADGRVYLKGREVHTDAEYRSAMMAINRGRSGCSL